MSQGAFVTLVGYVAQEPNIRTTRTGKTVTDLRVGITPRYRDRATDEWRDAEWRHRQRLLLRSWYAKLLAVRRVSQDNQGKKTPGIDGIAATTAKIASTISSSRPCSRRSAHICETQRICVFIGSAC